MANEKTTQNKTATAKKPQRKPTVKKTVAKTATAPLQQDDDQIKTSVMLPLALSCDDKPASEDEVQSESTGNDKPADDTEALPKSTGDDKSADEDEAQPDPAPFLIALVKAKNKNGFWRIGRHWTSTEKQVLVLTEMSDLAVVEAQLSGDDEEDDFDEIITLAQYKRLKAEPQLQVRLLVV